MPKFRLYDILNFDIAIFDLDLTLHSKFVLYNDVISILQSLKNKGVKLFVTSFNLTAKSCCEKLGIAQYFDAIYEGRDKNKSEIVKEILHNYNYQNAIFFDDNFENIIDVKVNTGIRTIHVGKTGLTWLHIPTEQTFTY